MKNLLLSALLMFSATMFAQDSLCTLPVHYVSFKCNVDVSKVAKIEWQTEEEINNDHFQLEKSVNGKPFEWVGNIPKNDFGYYYFFHQISEPTTFRIKQVDKDNHYYYSPTVFANIKLSGISVYPNPFVKEINLNAYITSKSTYKVAIRDMQGNLVAVKALLLSTGNNFVKITTDTISPGMYTISLSNGEKVLFTKPLIKK